MSKIASVEDVKLAWQNNQIIENTITGKNDASSIKDKLHTYYELVMLICYCNDSSVLYYNRKTLNFSNSNFILQYYIKAMAY